MDTIEECLITADNYAAAAALVGGEEARALMRLSAIWRNRALRIKLGIRAYDRQFLDEPAIARH